jgi:hypothetical protein
LNFWRRFGEGAGLKTLRLSRNDLSTVASAKAEAKNQKDRCRQIICENICQLIAAKF